MYLELFYSSRWCSLIRFPIEFYPFPSNAGDMTRTGFEEKQNHPHINNNNFQNFKELQNTWASEETFLLK